MKSEKCEKQKEATSKRDATEDSDRDSARRGAARESKKS
jgi:hypothetical protein